MASPPTQAAASRSRALHWVAWAAALASVAVLVWWKWGPSGFLDPTAVQWFDVGLGVFFAFEFFTRTGWRESRTSYLKWRWFDFVAIVPVTVLGPFAIAPVVWVVLICRVIRLVDRTLGDGYVQRNAFLLVSAVEEELSDRVLEKMLARWERELEDAKFGTVVGEALERNREAVLGRVYEEQLQEGAFAKIAHYSGLRGTIEKEEARMFGAIIAMLQSPEVDEAIRDAVASSLRQTREELGARDWRKRIGRVRPKQTEPDTSGGAARAPVPSA